MIRVKPHTATHYSVSDSKTGGRVDVPTLGSGVAIACQITPMTSDAAFKTFSGDLTISQPSLMLCDVSTYSRTIKSGDRITWNGYNYYVNAAPMIWEAGRSTDCVQILLEKEMHQ